MGIFGQGNKLHHFEKRKNSVEDKESYNEIYGITPVNKGVGKDNKQIDQHSDHRMCQETRDKFTGFSTSLFLKNFVEENRDAKEKGKQKRQCYAYFSRNDKKSNGHTQSKDSG